MTFYKDLILQIPQSMDWCGRLSSAFPARLYGGWRDESWPCSGWGSWRRNYYGGFSEDDMHAGGDHNESSHKRILKKIMIWLFHVGKSSYSWLHWSCSRLKWLKASLSSPLNQKYGCNLYWNFYWLQWRLKQAFHLHRGFWVSAAGLHLLPPFRALSCIDIAVVILIWLK